MKHRRLGDLSCMLEDNKLYAVPELAALWEMSRDTVYTQIKRRAIPVTKLRKPDKQGSVIVHYFLGRDIKEALIKRQEEKDKARHIRMRYRKKQRIEEATIDDTVSGAIAQGKFLTIKRQHEAVTDKYGDPEVAQEIAEVYNLLLDIKDIFPQFGKQ